MDDIVINYLFVDREKNIWITGQNNSLYFLSEKHFRNALRVQATLPGNNIPKYINGDTSGYTGISYINKKLFAIRYKGLLKFYPLDDAFYEGARCICPLGNGRFLIMDKDLALVDVRKNDVRYFNTRSTYKDVYLTKDGGLLVACLPNAFYLDAKALTASQPVGKQVVVFQGRTSAIASLADGTILVGTPDGLFLKKNLDARAVRIGHSELSHTNITDIADKGAHGALLSTNGQGIYYYNAQSGKAEAVKIFPGAGIGQVHRIFKQNDSMYWLSTEKGAYEVKFGAHAQIKHIRNYTFYDGLPANNITSVYVQQDTAFITTAEGPGVIPLRDSTLLQMAPPQIYLNSILFRDTTLLRPGTELELSYRRNDFQVSLSAISFESFGNIRYYYKMEGLADEWTETDIPEIRFAGLAPGTYLFKAFARNAKGIISKVPVTLHIRILPAFWQTFAFKAIAGLLVLLLLYFIIRRRAVKLALGKYEKARQQRRLAELELEAIKAQINPHFIYNCLNSIQYFNYEKRHEEARQYLDLFARLIRLTMQYSRETFISISEETDYLGNYLELEKMRFHERLHYRVEVAENIDRQTMIPAMLIQPYVENALKHGIATRREGGEVLVRFERPAPDLLLVSIEDDGLGFEQKQKEQKSSLGLRLSGSRAETYNQLFGMKIEIDFYNKKNYHPDRSGFIVQLKIPVKSYEHALF
jgi:signal transduction histidine kinase